MHLQHPYHYRIKVARHICRLVLILLVNGWVDAANYALQPAPYSSTAHYMPFDDYDTCYEWVAETVFDVVEAIPEDPSGNQEDTAGNAPLLKLVWVHQGAGFVWQLPVKGLPLFSLFTVHFPETPYQANWVPPPNVPC